MYLVNSLRELYFTFTANGESNIDVNIPSNINKVVVTVNNMTCSVAEGNNFPLIQTGKSGVFDTSGYSSGIQLAFYTTNAWINQHYTAGFILGTAAVSGSNLRRGGVYTIANLNTENQASITGGGYAINSLVMPQSIIVTGLSPTTNASMLRLMWVSGSITGGIFTVKSLV